MRFRVPDDILQKLRTRRSTRAHLYPIEDQEDAVLLDPGLGPEVYLTSDGRVLLCDPDGMWGHAGLREATDEEGYRGVAVGAKKTGIVDLLSLLPAKPPNGRECHRCNGERWEAIAQDLSGSEGHVVCTICNGLGWTL